MTDTLLTIAIVLSGLGVVLLLLLVLRKRADFGPLLNCFENLEKCQERTERGTKEEIARNRQEFAEQGRALREEVQISLKHSTDSLVQSVDHISKAQQQRLEDFAAQLGSLKQITDLTAGQQRQELSGTLKDFKDSLQRQMHEIAGLQKQQFDSFAAELARLTDTNQKKSDELRLTVEARLKELQTDNATKLEEMRRTVDEKLQGALEKRLGESFKLVSERLEQVHKGLGEMQSLASGVGDLKRVLTNVKARGTWGEMQLGNLLEQVLTTDQYARNVRPKPGSLETVEFAIKLPGREEDERSVVWLPIDAKFPKEDYERLVDATERGDVIAVEQAGKELEMRIRNQARNIRDKYLEPPATTDFGLLYLPTEGLYAEVIRRPGLLDLMQREHRVVIVGPTTLAALLNSLQMGFRTLAIQKRSSEVWNVLGAVKTEFGKFGDLLEKVKRKLDETGRTIDEAAVRSRQLEKKLKGVEALPVSDAAKILEFSSEAASEPETPDDAGDDAIAPAK